MLQYVYNPSRVHDLMHRYSAWLECYRSDLELAAKWEKMDIKIIRGLREQVNPMHDKVEKLTVAMERAQLLHEEGQREVEAAIQGRTTSIRVRKPGRREGDLDSKATRSGGEG